MNIYINQDNEKRLRQLQKSSMSGLINYLLEDYFRTHQVTNETPEGIMITSKTELEAEKIKGTCTLTSRRGGIL